MHKQWADLIPYYVAGTLSRRQAAELEQHLASCEKCRLAVQEWQNVANMVRSDAQRWAARTPQTPPQDVIVAAFSSNGSENSTTRIPVGNRQLSSRPASIVTMAAAIAVLFLGGLLVLFLQSQREPSSQGAPPQKTDLPTKVLSRPYTATPMQPPTFTPAGGTPNAYVSPTQSRPITSPSPYSGPTPTARYGNSIGTGSYVLITLAQIDQIPPNTPVRIEYAWFDGTDWVYAIVTSDGNVMGYARDWQLSYVSGYKTPVVTPPARYWDNIGVGGYSMITLERVGTIPAGARVRISQASFDGSDWMYGICTQNDAACADAREDQIAYAPGVTPGPTATSPFDSAYGYAMITLVQVGDIPANTRVSIGSAWYDRIDGWYYQIVTQDGVSATARQSQITYMPGLTPGPIPTSVFNNYPGGYPLITLEQIGQIPANSRVRISHSWYDSIDGWIYVIVAQDEQTTAEAHEYQLMFAPGVTPGPTPTARYMEPNATGYSLMLLEDAGAIRAGEPVRIGSGYYAALDGWTYTVVAQDEVRTAEVSEALIAPIGASTPTPTPNTCPYATTLTRDCPQTQFQIQVAYLPFEKGFMIWRSDTRQIYALYSDRNVYDTYVDTWIEGEAIPDDGQQPPAGTVRPQRGFGKIWASQSGVRSRLGWATGDEVGYITTVEMIGFNIALTLPSGQVLLLEEQPPIWVLVP